MSENKLLIAALIIVGLALAGSLYYVFRSSTESLPGLTQSLAITAPPPPQAPQPQPQPKPAPATEPSATPAPQPAQPEGQPAFTLPSLSDSDHLIRNGVVGLTRNEGINSWLGANQLIRRCVAFVDNAAHGKMARAQVTFLAPNKSFEARQISDNEYVMDPASYARYDRATSIFVSIDAERAVKFYLLTRPLFQKAYAELGYPDKDFDKVIFNAVDRLLKTPIITAPVKLVRPSVMYKFADPALESLSAAQKQLIRMGPKNTQAIQAKLKEMAADLRAALKD